MKVKLNSADSGLHEYMVEEFEDWNELMSFMKKEYGQWIVNFDKDNTEIFPESNPGKAEEIDLAVKKYDDYIE